MIRHPTNITDATCDTDHSAGSGTTFGSNPKIIKCDSTALLSEGMTVSGTGIATNSVITDILSNTLFKVDLDTTATNNNQTLTFTGFYGHQGYINARSWVGVIDSTTGVARTATQIATDFAALVNLRTSVFGINAGVIDSPTTGATNTAVKLVQNSVGKTGNTNFPSFLNGLQLQKNHTLHNLVEVKIIHLLMDTAQVIEWLNYMLYCVILTMVA